VKLRKFFSVGLFLAFISSAPAQIPRKTRPLPPSAFKLVSIHVIGTKRYTPDQIKAATGLQMGQTVNEDDFKAVSRQLGETGAFSDVAYAFQYSSEGAKLDIQLADATQFVPARFDNFVWLSDQELLQKLQARVPLFDGELPVAGNLADQVSDALQALILERKLQGKADYLRYAPQDGPITAFVYTVGGPTIHIRNVEFAGAAASELPLLQSAAKALAGCEYLRSVVRVYDEKDFLPVYLERGYLKAAFADAQPKIVRETPEETVVDVTVGVTPGLQYKLSELQLLGYRAFQGETLHGLIHQQMGQSANTVQLGKDLDEIKKLYGTRGYMAASIKAEPDFDDERSTVRYVLQFHEGDVYKMGDLEIQGLDTKTTARMVDAWKLRGGDVYDSSYPMQFVKEWMKELSRMGQWKVAMHTTLEDKDKLVDVTVRFDPKR
jgi:outer membrane protein assembly factor BamA